MASRECVQFCSFRNVGVFLIQHMLESWELWTGSWVHNRVLMRAFDVILADFVHRLLSDFRFQFAACLQVPLFGRDLCIPF